MILTRANRETPITLTLDNRGTGFYPQVKIYNINNELIETVNLTEIGSGEYKGTYTPDGTLSVLELRAEVYTDVKHSVVSTTYGKPETELMVIDDSGTDAGQEHIRQSIEGSKILDDDTNTLTIKKDDGTTDHIVYESQDANGNPAHLNIKRFIKQ